MNQQNNLNFKEKNNSFSQPESPFDYHHEGQLLKIYTYPHPILTKKAKLITQFDNDLKNICQNMLYTMYLAPGIGLAAPQVGLDIRLFVLDIDYKRSRVTHPDGQEETKLSDFNPFIFINPLIKNGEGQTIYQEGCLSLPGIYEEVQRYSHIIIEYQDLNGNKKEMNAEDLLAICIQHENDHLDGVVLLDRIGQIKRNLLKKKLLKLKKRKV